MGFFDRGEGDPGGGDRVQRFGGRGFPVAAEGRLSELGAGGRFSSTLSANEFALLTDLGPQPLAQVLGTSVCHVGWQYLPPEAQWAGQDLFCQLDAVSHARDQARRRAFDRLREDSERSAQPALLLSDISVQDDWVLTGAGWSPAGLLAATSAYFVSQGRRTRWRRRLSTMQNQELHEFSDGFAAARRAVVTDLRGQARAARADGLLVCP